MQDRENEAAHGFVVHAMLDGEWPTVSSCDANNPVVGTRFAPRQEAYVESRRRTAAGLLQPHGVGSLSCCTEHELVDDVLGRLVSLAGPALCNMWVDINILKHLPSPSSERWNVRKCIGVDDSWGPLRIPAAPLAESSLHDEGVSSRRATADENDFATFSEGPTIRGAASAQHKR